MTELEKFVEEMQKKYEEEVQFTESNCSIGQLQRIPEPLQEFYRLYDTMEFPFGAIEPATEVLGYAETIEPFRSEGWLRFGFDGYFSYWLCKRNGENGEECITTWDHDTDSEIEGAYTSLVEFLRDMEAEYEENQSDIFL